MTEFIEVLQVLALFMFAFGVPFYLGYRFGKATNYTVNCQTLNINQMPGSTTKMVKTTTQ